MHSGSPLHYLLIDRPNRGVYILEIVLIGNVLLCERGLLGLLCQTAGIIDDCIAIQQFFYPPGIQSGHIGQLSDRRLSAVVIFKPL